MRPEVKCQNGLTQLTRGDGVSGFPPSPPWIRLDYGQPPTLTLATNIWGDSRRGTLEATAHHPDSLGSHTCPSAVTRPPSAPQGRAGRPLIPGKGVPVSTHHAEGARPLSSLRVWPVCLQGLSTQRLHPQNLSPGSASRPGAYSRPIPGTRSRPFLLEKKSHEARTEQSQTVDFSELIS